MLSESPPHPLSSSPSLTVMSPMAMLSLRWMRLLLPKSMPRRGLRRFPSFLPSFTTRKFKYSGISCAQDVFVFSRPVAPVDIVGPTPCSSVALFCMPWISFPFKPRKISTATMIILVPYPGSAYTLSLGIVDAQPFCLSLLSLTLCFPSIARCI